MNSFQKGNLKNNLNDIRKRIEENIKILQLNIKILYYKNKNFHLVKIKINIADCCKYE